VNTVQIFALILSTIGIRFLIGRYIDLIVLLVPLQGRGVLDQWRKVFLGTMLVDPRSSLSMLTLCYRPNILALNFASTVVQSLIFLVIFMVITSGLLYHFYGSSIYCDRYRRLEGLQGTPPKSGQWGIMITTFLLTVFYMPLSTLAVHVLVWSQDLWVVPNPYINAASLPPTVPPLGPPSEYRDPLEFCWTTTMKKNEVNYAPAIVILSFLVFSFVRTFSLYT
jgi:hypothetical protein